MEINLMNKHQIDPNYFSKTILAFVKIFEQANTEVIHLPRDNQPVCSEQLEKTENTYIYIFLGKTFIFRYHSNKIKSLFHPLFAPLQNDQDDSTDHVFDLYALNGVFGFFYNDKHEGSFSQNELFYFKGAVLRKLYIAVYQLEQSELMLTTHAAVIANSENAVLFCGNSGSGKSTAVAQLQKYGYHVYTDDFTLITKNGRTYLSPSAISIKKGSLKVLKKMYPQLTSKRQVQYLPISRFQHGNLSSPAVKKVVFIRYDGQNKQCFEKLNKEIALPIFLKESWIRPERSNITKFLGWIDYLEFYRFSYKTTKSLVNFVDNIL